MKIPELDDRNRDLLIAGATLALGTVVFRSMKSQGHFTVDFSVWGEKTRRVFADAIDDTKQAWGRIAGELVLDSRGKVIDVQNIEISQRGGGPPEARLEVMENAVKEKGGWSGQNTTKNPLQNG